MGSVRQADLRQSVARIVAEATPSIRGFILRETQDLALLDSILSPDQRPAMIAYFHRAEKSNPLAKVWLANNARDNGAIPLALELVMDALNLNVALMSSLPLDEWVYLAKLQGDREWLRFRILLLRFRLLEPNPDAEETIELYCSLVSDGEDTPWEDEIGSLGALIRDLQRQGKLPRAMIRRHD